VASLGLVSHGAATDGVIFFKNTDDLSLVIALWKVMTFIAVVSSSLPSSHVVYAVFFLNSATTNNFIRVSPPWMVLFRAVRP